MKTANIIKEYSMKGYLKPIKKSEDAAKVFAEFIGEEGIATKEHFVAIYLDGASRPVKVELLFLGTANQSMVHPRDVFRPAIAHNAVGIIVGHNHPSGTLVPSEADTRITKRLKEAGNLLGIEIVDHLIVTTETLSEGKFYSFSDEWML